MESVEQKKRILSGIQPTGVLTIGNYLGAVKNWAAMQEEYDCFYFIADLHSITVTIEPSELRKNTQSVAAQLLAMGVSAEKSVLFVQSHVHEHSELAWVLNCLTYFGEAGRMAQFKDKSKKNPENINVGLFAYPVLQAADILLYQPDKVPVGQDQKQHIEITRTIAERFNARYSPTFTVPEPFIPKVGAKIMSLADPTKKMSKSDENINAFISTLDTPEVILRKVKRAVTDSESNIRYDIKNKAGISNLLSVMSAFSGKKIGELEKDFANANYGDFKNSVAECIIEGLRPVQNEYNRLIKDKLYLDGLLKDGAERASFVARRTLGKVYKKMGLYSI